MTERENSNFKKDVYSSVSDVEQEKWQKLFEERQKNAREQMSKLFDEAEKRNKKPIDIIIEENGFDRAAKVFGVEKIEKFKNDLQNLEYTDKEDFINKMSVLTTPFNYDRFFDPATRSRAEEVEALYRPETIRAGTLNVIIHPSEWDFTLSDGTKISKDEDVLLEISWPDEGEKTKGVKDIKDSFREIMTILKGRPHIKAVIGVSWMMSRHITDRLGFEKPDLPVKDEQRISILEMAADARKDKDYPKDKEVTKENVKVGAISRKEFIERYGK